MVCNVYGTLFDRPELNWIPVIPRSVCSSTSVVPCTSRSHCDNYFRLRSVPSVRSMQVMIATRSWVPVPIYDNLLKVYTNK